MTTLYHYTCDHGYSGITADGYLRPNAHPILPGRWVWLTDRPGLPREAYGLTSNMLRCDRMAHRFTTPDRRWGGSDVEPFLTVLGRLFPDRGTRRAVLDELCRGIDAIPRVWWVARWPVKIEVPR